MTGSYNLLGQSNINIYGYIYKEKFNPQNPFENLILENGVSCGDRQFLLTTVLQSGTSYILVVTTFSPNERGNFSILVYGPNNVTLNYISKYRHMLFSKAS